MTSLPRLRVALIGLMGAGKTRFGGHLAGALGWPFFDTDRMVEEAAGKPVSALFAEETEAGFRRREGAVLAVLGERPPPFVAALGGGIVLRPENLTCLSDCFYPIWLRVEAEEAWRRLQPGTDRPLLARGDPRVTLARLQRERDPLYAAVARLVLDTGADADLDSLCRETLDALRGLR
jgi:shikimate kinase